MSQHEENFGPFILKEVIGQGGMGKVYKAYDPINHRMIALKVIKDSLLKNPKSKKRFLQEAFIHAKLSHPSIIPIHGIEIHPEGTGYSMPFIEGTTLKTHLLKLKAQNSHMSLKERLRHVMKILEALDYTHKMGYIHRDVKSDNIFIGLHNDTYLFDWGLASKINDLTLEHLEESSELHLTSPGKIPGTLTHLAPERAFGDKGSVQSDLFSLGVVLYQFLTMKMPFFRKDLNHFKQIAGKETFPLPSTLNLKEDIDEALDLIVSRALATDLSKRYKNAQQFMHDLQKVLSGLPVWKDPLILDLTQNAHWLYQDMLPLGSYLALSQKSLSWGLLSVPYVTLVDNYKIFVSSAHRFKIYLNLARDEKGFNLDNCYILAIDPLEGITLHRVFAKIDEKNLKLEKGKEFKITLEKIEQHFYIWLDEELVFEFMAKVPSICPHMGLVVEDTDVRFSSICLYNSSSSQQVSCLKLGDNLVWHRCFSLAREEYQKIFINFQDHQEGREALFRYGYSYILEAKQNPSKKSHLLGLGIKSFEKFKSTKSSPWEYWGKALCYEALGQHLETIKCFELAFRKYPKHIFSYELKEELLSLFSQKSIKDKKGALRLAFVALKHLDDATFFQKYPILIESLEEELSPCFVLLDEKNLSLKQKLIFSLAYLLDQKLFLEELLQKSELLEEKINALLILCHLNSKILKIKFFNKTQKLLNSPHLLKDPLTNPPWTLARLSLAIYGHKTAPLDKISSKEEAFLSSILALIKNSPSFDHPMLDSFDQKISSSLRKRLSRQEQIKALKGSCFQDSERFVRSNFIISLLEKKPFDYFGYDKACLEFAIKALF